MSPDAVQVRCAGIWNGGPPCGWEGGMFADLLDEEGCPMCGGKVEEVPAVAGPAPNLQQVIHAAAEKLRLIDSVLGPMRSENYARIAVEAAWPHLAGQLQAAQAENQQLRKAAEEARSVARYLHDHLCEVHGPPDGLPMWIYQRAGYDDLEHQAALGQDDQP